MDKPRTMILLTYKIGSHVDPEVYEDWLRSTDNPFFNNIPGVKRYANWKVVDEMIGTVEFTHYDLLEIEDLASWKTVWDNKSLQEFANAWTERWSIHGTGVEYEGLNYQVVLAEEIAAPD